MCNREYDAENTFLCDAVLNREYTLPDLVAPVLGDVAVPPYRGGTVKLTGMPVEVGVRVFAGPG